MGVVWKFEESVYNPRSHFSNTYHEIIFIKTHLNIKSIVKFVSDFTISKGYNHDMKSSCDLKSYLNWHLMVSNHSTRKSINAF